MQWFVAGGQKLSDDDKPLVVVLMWGALDNSHCLCLVENKESTIDVMQFTVFVCITKTVMLAFDSVSGTRLQQQSWRIFS